MAFKDKASKTEWYRNRRKQIRELVVQLKDRPCVDCKVKYPSYVMQFDHLGDKQLEIGSATRTAKTLKQVVDEAKKCEVVCANCHAERTHRRKNI